MEKLVVDLQKISVCIQENIILRDINLQVKDNEFVFITGAVGTGKTSLLRTLYSDLKITNGNATVLGYDLKNIKNKDIPYLRRQIGIVFQDFKLLPDRNVADNLKFVLAATDWSDKNKIDSKIDEILTQLDITQLKYKMPYEMSGGEQQCVTIARALLNSPCLVLADEPTANLDETNVQKILTIFTTVAQQNSAVIFATHNLEIVNKLNYKSYKIENKQIN